MYVPDLAYCCRHWGFFFFFFKLGSASSMELRVELELVTLRSRSEARWRVGHLSDGPPRCPLHWEFLKAHISVLQKFWFSGSRLQSKKLYFITLPRWFWGRQSVDPLLASVFILWLGGLLSGVGTSREIERAVLYLQTSQCALSGFTHKERWVCDSAHTHSRLQGLFQQ